MRKDLRFMMNALIAALIMFANPGSAQAFAPLRPPSDQLPITVTGRLKQTISAFVKRLTLAGPTDQIARWNNQVCPEVLGIDPSEAKFMEQRIDDLARTVRLRPGGSNCLSSLAIVVTRDPRAFVDAMVKAYPISLRTDGWGRLRRFTSSTKPVRWISVSDECAFGCGMGSRINRETGAGLQAMLIVVDANQLVHITIGELSDYVALVSLTNPPDQQNNHSNSILSLFDEPVGSTGTLQLTEYDRAFLAALYRSSPNRGASDQRGAIRRGMQKSLEKPHP